MRFIDTGLAGVLVIEPEVVRDERGFFARVWAEDEFKERGLLSRVVHANVSGNPRAGTLRGLHYQTKPHEEAKIVRCTRGSIFDVALDLRSDSPSFRKWISFELNEQNHRMLYIPEGCAHGFQTLEDNSDVSYFMSHAYHSESASGIRWNDPAFNITWPLPVSIISEKDRSYPDFS